MGELVLLVAALGALACGMWWRRSIRRQKERLLSVAVAIDGRISRSEAQASDGSVGADSYGALDRLLADELPRLDMNVARLGPAFEGMTIRMRLVGEAFRTAFGEDAGHPARDRRCREMVLQLKLAAADAVRRLGPQGQGRK
jgi:hypothetical protein